MEDKRHLNQRVKSIEEIEIKLCQNKKCGSLTKIFWSSHRGLILIKNEVNDYQEEERSNGQNSQNKDWAQAASGWKWNPWWTGKAGKRWICDRFGTERQSNKGWAIKLWENKEREHKECAL